MLSIVYSRTSGPREIARTYYAAFRMRLLDCEEEKISVVREMASKTVRRRGLRYCDDRRAMDGNR